MFIYIIISIIYHLLLKNFKHFNLHFKVQFEFYKLPENLRFAMELGKD